MNSKYEVDFEKSLFRCWQCHKHFSSSLNLKRHIESVHYYEAFTCKRCGEVFNRKDSLRRHKKIHKKKREKLLCDICGKQFITIDIFNRHKNVHNSGSSEEFKCELCGANFTRKDNFETHQKGISNKDGSFVHKCSQCNEIFCNSKLLKSHRNSMHVKNISCEECGQSFTLKSSLELHIKRRIIVKCDECEKTFCNSKALSIHKNKIHNCVECDVCGKRYQKKYVEVLQHHKFWDHNQTPNK